MFSLRTALTKSAHVPTASSSAANRLISVFSILESSASISDCSVLSSDVELSVVALVFSESEEDSGISLLSMLLLEVSEVFSISLSDSFFSEISVLESIVSLASAIKIFAFGSKIISNKKKISLRRFIFFSPPSHPKS